MLQCVAAGSGTCIGFNPFLEHLFLVGSESGHVYTCSKAYTKHFLNVTKVCNTYIHGRKLAPVLYWYIVDFYTFSGISCSNTNVKGLLFVKDSL